MPKKYTIRDGFSFIDENNDVKTGGAVIELEDDVAANHAHKLELVAEPVPFDPAIAAKTIKKVADIAPEAGTAAPEAAAQA